MQGDNQFFSVFGSGGSSSSGGISGSGTNNYVAKWTPDGTTLGNSLIRDNGTTIGINVSPFSNAIVYIDNSTNSETLRLRNTRDNGYGINSQATGGGTNIYGGTFNATSSTSTNNIGIRASTQGTITGSNVAGSFATANTPYTTTYLGLEYVGIHSQVATNGAKNVAGLFISNSSNSTDNTGVYIKVSNAGSGNAYGIYEPDGAFNYFEGNVGIGVTPLNSESILTVEDTRNSNLPAIYGFNNSSTYSTGVQGAVGNNVSNTSINIPTEGLVGVYGEVNNSDSEGTDYALRGIITSSSNSMLASYGLGTLNAYTGNSGSANIYGGFIESRLSGNSAQVSNSYGLNVIGRTSGTITATNFYGAYIELSALSGSPNITNSYALYIDTTDNNYNNGATNKYGIYQNGVGLNYFSDNIQVEGGQIWSQQPATAMTISTNNATFDCDTSNGQVLNLNSATADVTLTFTNMKAGGTYFLKVIQNAITPYDIGTYSVSGGNVLFPSGTAPTISTGASAIDTIVFYYDGTNLLANFSQDYQ
jgi:hypothetical protein